MHILLYHRPYLIFEFSNKLKHGIQVHSGANQFTMGRLLSPGLEWRVPCHCQY